MHKKGAACERYGPPKGAYFPMPTQHVVMENLGPQMQIQQ